MADFSSRHGQLGLACEEAFKLIDRNGDGVLSRIEVIQACRSDERVAKLLRLPKTIKQEDGSRDRFEEIFRQMDTDDSKEVDQEEFKRFWISHVLPHLWEEMTKTPSTSSSLSSSSVTSSSRSRSPRRAPRRSQATRGRRHCCYEGDWRWKWSQKSQWRRTASNL